MSDQPDRAVLEAKSRDDLVAMASALGIAVAPRARKATIIDDILNGPSTEQDDSQVAETTRRVRRSPAAGESESTGDASSKNLDVDDSAPSEDDQETEPEAPKQREDDDPSIGEPGNRRRRRRGRDRDRDDNWQGEPVPCEGILDLRDEGYGFLRTTGPLPSNDDVYVAAKQVRTHGLRKGDVVKGASRPAARNEKNPALVQIDEINGAEPGESRERPLFEDLRAVHPHEPLRLEVDGGENPTARVIDLVAPIGKGQRGLVISPPECGKTSTIRELAVALESNHPDLHLILSTRKTSENPIITILS